LSEQILKRFGFLIKYFTIIMAYGNFAEEGFYGFCDQKAKDFDFIQKNLKNFFRKIEKVF
jgi:hypothetical protein